MSQKTNPISLRLQKSNKHFESSWYSDYFYNEMNSHDLNVRSYIENVVNQMNNLQALFYIQNEYKKFLIYMFFQDARGIRSERGEALRVSRMPLQPLVVGAKAPGTKKINSSNKAVFESDKVNEAQNPSKTATTDKQDRIIFQCCRLLLSLVKKDHFICPDSTNRVCVASLDSSFEKKVHTFVQRKSVNLDSANRIFVKEDGTQSYSNRQLLEMVLMRTAIINPSIRRTTRFLDTQLLKNGLYPINYISIYPIRVIQDIQNAHFLINEIVHLLQKRVGFRQIKDQILREILKNESKRPVSDNLTQRCTKFSSINTATKTSNKNFVTSFCSLFVSSQIIKGIRISCSGRFGGRSKKAQKTKTQSIRWGETSLHAFSSKLSFGSKSANTSFGKVGIKVWICFK